MKIKTLRLKKGLLLLLSILFSTISCSDPLEEDVVVDMEKLRADNNDNNKDEEESDEEDQDDNDDDDDDEFEKHPSLFFVQLPQGIDEDEVEDLLEDLNSEEVWFREEINLRLWNTSVFPYTSAQGEQVTNIDGQIARARTRTRVSGATFNVGGIVDSPLASQNLFCFEQSVNLQAPADNELMISIFDTGIDTSMFPKFSGYDYINDDEKPEDTHGHGTQVTGLIHKLITQNGSAENIEIDIRKTHDNQGLGFASTLIPAILDAVNEGTDFLNFSFSYQDVNEDTANRPMRLAIDYAEQNGVLILAAAGNTNKDNDKDAIISFPASYPNANIISNAALSCENKLSGFSSYGKNSVDLAFLGENIPVEGLNGSAFDQSGTSFSTACLTAMAAIMASNQENMDAAAIKCALINTSDYSDNLKDVVASKGVVNFEAALANMNNCN